MLIVSINFEYVLRFQLFCSFSFWYPVTWMMWFGPILTRLVWLKYPVTRIVWLQWLHLTTASLSISLFLFRFGVNCVFQNKLHLRILWSSVTRIVPLNISLVLIGSSWVYLHLYPRISIDRFANKSDQMISINRFAELGEQFISTDSLKFLKRLLSATHVGCRIPVGYFEYCWELK